MRKSPAFAFDLEFVPVIQNEPLDVMNLGLADIGGGSSIFAEAVLPVRFQEDSFGDGFTSIGFGIHLGVGF